MPKETQLLITGANGYLGARLQQDLSRDFSVVGTYNRTPLLPDQIHLDVTKAQQVEQVVSQVRPEYIIHTANYPSPRQAEGNEQAYRDLNLGSLELLVEAANSIGAMLIFISSYAALNPDNIYGELKLKSEEITKLTVAGWLNLRASLILGWSPNETNDRPFNRVLKMIRTRQPAGFDTSWQFQPTYIGHVSQVIAAAIHQDVRNGLVHVACRSAQTQYSTVREISEPFAVEPIPVDKQLKIPYQDLDDSDLLKFGLPNYRYEDMIEQIHKEIKVVR